MESALLAMVASNKVFSLEILCLLWGVQLILYRLINHPLAGIPGNRLAAATYWYEFYFDVFKRPGGQYYFAIEKMHKKWGPIIRVTPDEVHIRDPKFYHRLYVSGSPRHKDPRMANMLGTPMSSFGTADYNIHKSRRAPNAVMLSRKAIERNGQAILNKSMDRLCQKISSMHHSREVHDIRVLFLGYVSEFLSEYFIDFCPDFLDNLSELETWFRAIESLPMATPLLRQIPWLVKVTMNLPRTIQALVSSPLARMVKLHDLMRTRAQDFLRASQALRNEDVLNVSTEGPKTIFHAIYNYPSEEKEKSFDRLWQEAFTLYIGGVDTTSRTLAFATYYLLSNTQYLIRLQRELDILLPVQNTCSNLGKLEKLPLLTAVVKETLRCMYLVTGRIPLVCEEEITYQDYVIPAGSTISMTITDILNDPDIFPEPEIFNPDRWLDSETGKLKHELDHYFVAFGRGSRNCQGQEIAWVLIRNGIAAIFRRFNLDLHGIDHDRDIKFISDCFFGERSASSKGIRVRITGIRY